jgi:hypothetical protein
MKREKLGQSEKWALHTRVIAEFLRKGIDVQLSYLHEGHPRKAALEREQQEIARLKVSGLVLANRQLNADGPKQAEDVVRSILSARVGRIIRKA